uniref:Mediator of RNA polymerase II transcription subunit 7 n=1 Tax=Parastrongyloides trichosuri TaxID=131310 RepID=A0A0N4ZU99_PARTI
MDPNQPAVSMSPFPYPPEYSLEYTTENIKLGRFHYPPQIPKKYKLFGIEYDRDNDKEPSLVDLKIPQLYNSKEDIKKELKKLNKSMIAAYLDLLDVLIRCPSDPERIQRIEQLRLLFINFHHLCNQLRPIQARDNLVAICEDQVIDIIRVTESLRQIVKLGKSDTFDLFKKYITALKERNDKFLKKKKTLIKEKKSIEVQKKVTEDSSKVGHCNDVDMGENDNEENNCIKMENKEGESNIIIEINNDEQLTKKEKKIGNKIARDKQFADIFNDSTI